MQRITRLFAVLSLAVGASGCATTNADMSTAPLPPLDKTATPPQAFLDFCQRFADQCGGPKAVSYQVTLTDTALQLIELVNTGMNHAIQPEEDWKHYGREEVWTIPVDGYGDCDDYVLVKRKALINLGVPESALRIALVYTKGLARHALLTVVTDKGNYVLDNLTDEIRSWERTPYIWIKWQDPKSKSGWASLK